MTAEEYIAQYGAALTDAEKRYILAFGPPQSLTSAPARNPETPALRNAARGNTTDEAHARTERGSYYARDTLTGSSDERSHE